MPYNLNQVKQFIILEYYKIYFKKIDLYKEKILYNIKKKKKFISYKKI